MALQLTNILRDVGADAARGRLYLPLDELHALRAWSEELISRRRRPARTTRSCGSLLALPGGARARRTTSARSALLPRGGPPRPCSPAEMMAAVYREMLDELVAPRLPARPVRGCGSRARARRWIALRTLVRARRRP